MIRSFLTVSTGNRLPRGVLGFVRDAASRRCSAPARSRMHFLVAFQLVNVVRRLLSEGALNAALVPAWLRVRETEAPSQRRRSRGACWAPSAAALIAAAALIGL